MPLQEFKVWRARLATNIGRLRQNEEQPPRLEHYAPVGFKKITVPEPAWAAIQVRQRPKWLCLIGE